MGSGTTSFGRTSGEGVTTGSGGVTLLVVGTKVAVGLAMGGVEAAVEGARVVVAAATLVFDLPVEFNV